MLLNVSSFNDISLCEADKSAIAINGIGSWNAILRVFMPTKFINHLAIRKRTAARCFSPKHINKQYLDLFQKDLTTDRNGRIWCTSTLPTPHVLYLSVMKSSIFFTIRNITMAQEERRCISNHRQLRCCFNSMFSLTITEISQPRVLAYFEENPPVSGDPPCHVFITSTNI